MMMMMMMINKSLNVYLVCNSIYTTTSISITFIFYVCYYTNYFKIKTTLYVKRVFFNSQRETLIKM